MAKNFLYRNAMIIKFYCCCIFIAGIAQAAPRSGEVELERAMEVMAEFQSLVKTPDALEFGKAETDPGSDPLAKAGSEFFSSIKRSAELGNPVGQYYWAQLLTKQQGDYAKKREDACIMLEKSAAGGLLAAAVSQIYRCDFGFRSMNMDDPEHLKLIDRIASLLKSDDLGRRYYPLPLASGLCFPNLDMVTVKGLPFPMRIDRPTSYAEFQAEAYMLLAITSFNEKKKEGAVITYLEKADALGCTKANSYKEMLKIDAKKSNTKMSAEVR